MLHSSVCISSDPTSWLVVRQLQCACTCTDARTCAHMHTCTHARRMSLSQRAESCKFTILKNLLWLNLAARQSEVAACGREYRRVIDSRVTIMVSQRLPRKQPRPNGEKQNTISCLSNRFRRKSRSLWKRKADHANLVDSL